MKATEQYFPVVLFIMLYKEVLLYVLAFPWKAAVLPFKWKLVSSTFL